MISERYRVDHNLASPHKHVCQLLLRAWLEIVKTIWVTKGEATAVSILRPWRSMWDLWALYRYKRLICLFRLLVLGLKNRMGSYHPEFFFIYTMRRSWKRPGRSELYSIFQPWNPRSLQCWSLWCNPCRIGRNGACSIPASTILGFQMEKGLPI